jgi:hypothetical protein
VDRVKPTDAEVARYQAMHLGRSSQSETSMRIVRDDLGRVHVGDTVRYVGYGGQFQQNIRFRSKVGTVTELYGDGGLSVHFPHRAKGSNLDASISDFRLVRCVHQEPAHTTELADRWSIVVIRELDGTLNALSRRLPGLDGTPFSGPWAMLTEDEATELAEIYNADERDESKAEPVAVYRYDNDPYWPEQYT